MIRLLATHSVASLLTPYASRLAAAGMALEMMPESAPTPTDYDCLLTDPRTFEGALRGSAPVIVIATEPRIAEAVAHIKAGASDYLEPPASVDDLIAAVERAMADQRLPLATAGSDTPAVEIPGECDAIKDLRARIHAVAETDSPVLIVGEVGSGKEVVARALHGLSARRYTPLLNLNCHALPPTLVEAELFGTAHAQGAQRGLILAAQRGTLLLEDVGALSTTAQARLLDILKTGSLRLPGSTERIRVNVRIIATANQTLAALVAAGRFSSELEQHIAALTLHVPALRERGDDVIQLAGELLQKLQRRLGRSGLRFSDDSVARLKGYHWPGNVTELENAIERAVLLCSDEVIGPTELGLRATLASAPEKKVSSSDQPLDNSSLEEYFVNFVLEHQDSMTETQLAERLGISRKSLWERRQRLNIPRTRTRKRGRRQDSA
ncbi:MAG: sigma-54 dependent transcriptional regulator [Pseudomonadota bacterium]